MDMQCCGWCGVVTVQSFLCSRGDEARLPRLTLLNKSVSVRRAGEHVHSVGAGGRRQAGCFDQFTVHSGAVCSMPRSATLPSLGCVTALLTWPQPVQ